MLVRGQIRDNKIVDDRGGGSTLGYGVYLTIKDDGLLRVWGNQYIGAGTANEFYDTANFPTLASLPDTTDTLALFTKSVNIGAGGNLRIGNTGTALQRLHVDGTALISAETIQNADNSGAAFTWASNHWQSFRDVGEIKSLNGATTAFAWSNAGANLGFYGHATAGQPTNAGLLTDSTGGTVDGTLVDVGAVPTQANVNNNFADCAAKIEAIRAALRSIGLMA